MFYLSLGIAMTSLLDLLRRRQETCQKHYDHVVNGPGYETDQGRLILLRGLFWHSDGNVSYITEPVKRFATIDGIPIITPTIYNRVYYSPLHYGELRANGHVFRETQWVANRFVVENGHTYQIIPQMIRCDPRSHVHIVGTTTSRGSIPDSFSQDLRNLVNTMRSLKDLEGMEPTQMARVSVSFGKGMVYILGYVRQDEVVPIAVSDWKYYLEDEARQMAGAHPIGLWACRILEGVSGVLTLGVLARTIHDVISNRILT